MENKKIYLAFLWHQHQPMYKNPITGVYELPWVRLHACKDYYDTAAILDSFPKIKSNFNVVPSLLVQLDEYAKGTANDKFLELTKKNADTLTLDDKIFILHNFFMANWDTMVLPYPRYAQLLEKRGKHVAKADLARIQTYFVAQDFRDLQTWFNLAWIDPYWKQNDEIIKYLYEKGSKFTEEDKHALIIKQLEICGMVVQKYKKMQENGQIEVSVTPFYHPILPLLCDTNRAKESNSNVVLPKKRFQHRKDAQVQIQKAVDYYKQVFGCQPKGMWPSEGSVSEDVIPLFQEAGLNWVATDEEILFHSSHEAGTNRGKLFQPYSVDILGHKVNMVFRDHALSDSIGFIYSRWHADHAVSDFLNKIHSIRESVKNHQGNNLITVILDGENCWEYYSNDGWDFLKALYQRISDDPLIETVRISDYLEQNPPSDTLHKIWPGSWINANYNIWLGHTEDNLSWDYLSETRNFLTDYITKNPEKADSQNVKDAWERLYMAEGSDWNWWYGDDHSSGNDDMFDYLYRQYLISVYEALGYKAPDHLNKSIKGAMKKNPTIEPIDFIKPTIDGKTTSYFEWHPAGFYQVGFAGGSMHQIETMFRAFYYGFDLENIYLRFDLTTHELDKLLKDITFKISFTLPQNCEVVLKFESAAQIEQFFIQTPDGKFDLKNAAANKIIELAIPLDKFAFTDSNKQIEFSIAIFKNEHEVERWPYMSAVSFPKPTENFFIKSWSV